MNGTRASRPLVGASTMMSLMILAVVLAACGGGEGTSDSTASTTSVEPPAAATTARVIEGEAYREAAGDETGLTVDIYVGDGAAGAPAVVLLHGFGTSGPGRPLTSVDDLATEIAGLGSVVFSFAWNSGGGFTANSVADVSCIGPFVASRAREFGADPDRVIVVGHSMGAEAGSMLAFTSFNMTPSSECTELASAPRPVAFVGIAGAYGMVGGPIDDEQSRFLVRTYPRGTLSEFDADQEILPGLTASQLYELDGFSALEQAHELEVVLVVGSEDQYDVSHPDVTAEFAEAIEASGIDVTTVVVDGADHDDIVDPTTDFGQQTLQQIAAALADSG